MLIYVFSNFKSITIFVLNCVNEFSIAHRFFIRQCSCTFKHTPTLVLMAYLKFLWFFYLFLGVRGESGTNFFIFIFERISKFGNS